MTTGELKGMDAFVALEKTLERQDELKHHAQGVVVHTTSGISTADSLMLTRRNGRQLMLEEEKRVLVSSCEQLRSALDNLMRSESRRQAPL